MPELPEVEVVRRGLEANVVGRTIAVVTVAHPRAVRRHIPGGADFAARLAGRTFVGARRRGKYLWLPLDDGDALLAHLGMSGQLLVRPTTAPDETHLRVRFTFTDSGASTGGTELRFVDQRTFGGLALAEGGAELPAVISHIARDPLDPAFDEAAFSTALRRRRTGLKRALLDQTLVSGVGNIYADEALWRAGLHYARPTETLTRAQIDAVLDGARSVMGAALAQGGTSFDALFVDVNGQSGYFDRTLEVYGRAGKPCGRCGTPISREPFMNRSSHFCPQCQPRPRRGRW
ncbi:MAG: bifunctional DNA-formamidopyrimidine glycosylase/DNA-(apurinic or apyrimidinic site) lyase [Sporichthyaceae bacterium]